MGRHVFCIARTAPGRSRDHPKQTSRFQMGILRNSLASHQGYSTSVRLAGVCTTRRYFLYLGVDALAYPRTIWCASDIHDSVLFAVAAYNETNDRLEGMRPKR